MSILQIFAFVSLRKLIKLLQYCTSVSIINSERITKASQHFKTFFIESFLEIVSVCSVHSMGHINGKILQVMILMMMMLLKVWCCPALLLCEKMFWQVFGNLGSQCVRSKYQILKTSILEGEISNVKYIKYALDSDIAQSYRKLFVNQFLCSEMESRSN